MAPDIDVSMASPLAREALRRGLLVTVDSVEAARDHLLEELNCYEMENGQLKKIKLENDAA